MNLLYISEDHLNSKVHHQLCNALMNSEEQLNITLFSVARTGIGFQDIRSLYEDPLYDEKVVPLTNSHFFYKYWFPYKIRTKWRLLLNSVDLFQINYVHAATLFSEGIMAYRCWKYYGIPYSVTIRGTDINFYLKKMPHLWHLGREIVRNAKKVIFISPAQQKSAYLAPPFFKIQKILEEKSIVIPNGLDPYWHLHRAKREVRKPSKWLYVGKFDRNKNVEFLIESFLKARVERSDWELHLVGGGGDREQAVLQLIEQNPEAIVYHGVEYDKERLQQYYREADAFIMVSKSETFGLVYLEALSQGLPVIYTKGEAIDQLFENQKVGIAATLKDPTGVTNAMLTLFDHYDEYCAEVANLDLSLFDWEKIANSYISFLSPYFYRHQQIAENEELPFISIICPVYNEENYVKQCIESVIASDYPHSLMEFFLIEGGSKDRTREIIGSYTERYPWIKIVENPEKIVPYALNYGIEQAIGDLIIRIDAHAIYPRNYILDLVRWQMRLDADNVGGLCRTLPPKPTTTARVIAEVVSSKFGMGNAYFRVGISQVRKVDTVPFGCFRRTIFEEIGLFDTELIRNQDDEFNGRINKYGGSVYLVPQIVSDYYARDTIKKTARMFFQYGLYKPLVNKKLGSPATLRQFVPPLFVLGLIVGTILAATVPYIIYPFLLVLIIYLGTALDYGRKGSRKWADWKFYFVMPWVFFVVHCSYGVGYWHGLYKVMFKKSFQAEVNR